MRRKRKITPIANLPKARVRSLEEEAQALGDDEVFKPAQQAGKSAAGEWAFSHMDERGVTHHYRMDLATGDILRRTGNLDFSGVREVSPDRLVGIEALVSATALNGFVLTRGQRYRVNEALARDLISNGYAVPYSASVQPPPPAPTLTPTPTQRLRSLSHELATALRAEDIPIRASDILQLFNSLVDQMAEEIGYSTDASRIILVEHGFSAWYTAFEAVTAHLKDVQLGQEDFGEAVPASYTMDIPLLSRDTTIRLVIPPFTERS